MVPVEHIVQKLQRICVLCLVRTHDAQIGAGHILGRILKPQQQKNLLQHPIAVFPQRPLEQRKVLALGRFKNLQQPRHLVIRLGLRHHNAVHALCIAMQIRERRLQFVHCLNQREAIVGSDKQLRQTFRCVFQLVQQEIDRQLRGNLGNDPGDLQPQARRGVRRIPRGLERGQGGFSHSPKGIACVYAIARLCQALEQPSRVLRVAIVKTANHFPHHFGV